MSKIFHDVFPFATTYRLNGRAFQNGTFIFNVPDGSVTLHRSLVARESKGLAAMMEIGMRESNEGAATLQTDLSTLARFAEYVYTGDYNAAPAVLPNEKDLGHESYSGATERGDALEDAGPQPAEPHFGLSPEGEWNVYVPPPAPVEHISPWPDRSPSSRKTKSSKPRR